MLGLNTGKRLAAMTTAIGALVLGGGGLALVAGPSSVGATPAPLQVVFAGLNYPKHLSFGPDGALYVAETGTGSGTPVACPPGPTCVSATGEIARVTTAGVKSVALSGLPSVSDSVIHGPPGTPPDVLGPSSVQFVNGKLQVTVQDTNVNPDGTNPYGSGGALLGTLLAGSPGGTGPSAAEADLAAFQAANPNKNNGGGMGEATVDSDPYSVVPYNGGLAVADAAANDVLWVSPTNIVSVLFNLPTVPAGSGTAQSVPTSLAVGPDGALYVGELTGAPFPAGAANVYRIAPNQTPTVYASGFSTISDIAFDNAGRLLVLQIGTLSTGTNDAQLIRMEPGGSRTVVADASQGLLFPTGMAVAPDGSIYVSNHGIFGAIGPPGAPVGEIDHVTSTLGGASLTAGDGYRLAASDGGIFAYGADSYLGGHGGTPLNQPVVGITGLPGGSGYWEVASDGGIFNYGAAPFLGSTGALVLNKPVVGMAATPDGRGYWLVASDGGVFAFGDANFWGSTGALVLNKPVVGMAATPDGGGYWLVASDGGVFAFGDASYFGSTGGLILNKPVVGMAATPDGGGYWLVASDGGIFAFGNAAFLGSTGALVLNKPVVGMRATGDGAGYWLVASDGGIFAYGDALFFGSTGALTLNKPVVGME